MSLKSQDVTQLDFKAKEDKLFLYFSDSIKQYFDV